MTNTIKKTLFQIVANTGNSDLKVLLQERIAKQCGVSYKSVYRWLENTSQPSTERLLIIFRILKEHKPELEFSSLIEEQPKQKVA